MNNSNQAVANFLFEIGILAKTPRSAFPFLGTGSQSVAEHIQRTAYVGLALAEMAGDVDTAKVVIMCLLHDMPESRSSDLNYVHQQYVQVDEEKVIQEITQKLPFGLYIEGFLKEYKVRQSKEAILAKDADNIEWILALKEQLDLGNKRAAIMIKNAAQRLKTKVAHQLYTEIMQTPADAWFAESKNEDWWINRKS
ncbi:MAG: HD domain-containing protein [Candidatus Abawacabacteria bacterium]|nr:HD domain-containing protein [Candidatus Abawacabacteria bacterium]